MKMTHDGTKYVLKPQNNILYIYRVVEKVTSNWYVCVCQVMRNQNYKGTEGRKHDRDGAIVS